MTTFALYMASRKLGRNGDSKSLNFWFRMRILFQGLTVAAIIAGSYVIEKRKREEAALIQEDAVDERVKERLEFEARLRGAEEAHAFEQELARLAANPPKEEKSVWEKLGLGRGSHKRREATVVEETPTAPALPPVPVSTAVQTSPAQPAPSTSSSGIWRWIGWRSSSSPSDPEKKA